MRKILGLLNLFLIFLPVSVHSQERVDSLCIYFQVNRFDIDSSFNGNGLRMKAFAEKILQGGAENRERLHFVINASASPEGGERLNEALALARAESLADWLMSVTGLGRESIDIAFAGVVWSELRDLVLESGMEYGDEVADIIDNVPVFIFEGKEIVDSRRKRLMDLAMGNPYRFMLKNIFPQVRNARASVRCIFLPDTTAVPHMTAISDSTAVEDTVPSPLPLLSEDSAKPVIPAVPADTLMHVTPGQSAADTLRQQTPEESAAEVPEESVAEIPEAVVAECPAGAVEETPADTLSAVRSYVPQIKVKSNAVGLSMLMANAGVEIDVHPKLSVNIPIYYSGINYFNQTVKFRFLGFQPELRYWPGPKRRLYAGFHLGVAYYNFAWGREWRYQDKGGKTPTWGGGLGVGYRLPLDKEERWNVEFTIGAGLYDLNYDRFYNVPNGALESSNRKLFIGLDNVAVSFSYSFDMKKKGGDR